MLFAIFVGFYFIYINFFRFCIWLFRIWKISFLLNDASIFYGYDGTNTCSCTTLCLYGNYDGTSWSNERLFSAFQMMLQKLRALYYAVLFVSVLLAAATGIVGASVTILGIILRNL